MQQAISGFSSIITNDTILFNRFSDEILDIRYQRNEMCAYGNEFVYMYA